MKIKLFIGGGDTINGILEAAYLMANLLNHRAPKLYPFFGRRPPQTQGSPNSLSNLVKLRAQQISAMPFRKSFGHLKNELQTCSEGVQGRL